MTSTDPIRRFAVLGNHLPRQCGIATFTTHLTDALLEHLPGTDGFVVAMNDAGRRHAYPARVRFEIAEGDLPSYRRAADFLNVNQVDVLSVQHEYGIFGGKAGAHLLDLLVLLQRTEAARVDRGVVNEDVGAAAFLGDEAKALFGVEPLHGSGSHKPSLGPKGCPAPEPCKCENKCRTTAYV